MTPPARPARRAGLPFVCLAAGWVVVFGAPGARADFPDAPAAGRESSETSVPSAFEEEAPSDYDPWQRFNEKMFAFNHDVLDRYVMKPLATAWDKTLPDAAQRGIARAFDNLDSPKRLVNNVLQGRLRGAGRELIRFGINTTVGVVGFLDVAKSPLHVEKSAADMGQTLGVYGFGPGPYLVLPTLPPLTVRDGIGYGIDGALDPFGYVLPIPFYAFRAISLVNQVNERSLNLQIFQDVEEAVLDLYSAVRNGYLQRRRATIRSAVEARHAEWEPPGEEAQHR